MPFVVEEDQGVVAHVGVLPVGMVIEGREVEVAAIHAVCTHAQYRGRGYFRRLMQEALAWCETWSGAQMLFTDQPQLYERFGFGSVREHHFRVPCAGGGGGGSGGMRRLDLETAHDLALVTRLLAARRPVSRMLGIARETAIFAYHASGLPLYHAEDWGAVVAAEVSGETLALKDVVTAGAIPPLREIVARWHCPVREVLVQFAPDGLACIGEAIAAPSELMARGPFVSAPCAVPPTARC